MQLDPTFLSNFFLILAAWGGAFIAALWLSLVLWTLRDIRRRARDPLARILAVLVVAILFIPGVVIYLILRPARTLEDEYQQSLEEEALLRSIEDSSLCPGCGRHTHADWIICPQCHTRLRKSCHQCGKLIELPWNLCPYCGATAPGMRRENMSMEDALQSPPTVETEDGQAPIDDGIGEPVEQTIRETESSGQ